MEWQLLCLHRRGQGDCTQKEMILYVNTELFSPKSLCGKRKAFGGKMLYEAIPRTTIWNNVVTILSCYIIRTFTIHSACFKKVVWYVQCCLC